ncbi:MAG: hypothetical protein ABJF04_00210 [Reichenbachiella sp.]|uniref:hypothetical protein n=1 Tax=Reichenbachiella sp. TaxID=2184521 RepID=UPI003265ACBD
MKPAFFLFLALFSFIACDDDANQVTNCVTVSLIDEVDFINLISNVPENVLTKFIDYPDENGALGRNKEGYIHVRSQVAMTYLVEEAIRSENEETLDAYVQNLNYSFSRQTEAGDFEFVAPPDAPNNQAPPATRLANETAIYAYGLGASLLLLEQSEWYNQLADNHSAKMSIADLNEEIDLLLQYLKTNIELLREGDGMSPSRLFYDVIAIYLLGGYLQDEEGAKLSLPMLERVFAAHNSTEGYFTEAGGWDSSYNGESIKLGLELYALLSGEEHATIRTRLMETVTCAANWQAGRISETGEISTEGNSLIYPGGESMGGMEKKVDVEKTTRAFSYMNYLASDESYAELNKKILEFY